LVAKGHEVGMFCTQDALDGMKQLEIEAPLTRVHVIESSSGPSFFSRKWHRLKGIFVLLFLLRSAKVQHVHIAANPGPFTFFYSLGSRWLPAYSFSMVDSLKPAPHERSWLQRWIIKRSIQCARTIDCLSPSIAESALRIAPHSDKSIIVSPCSFTDLARVKVTEKRDIDFLFMARFTRGKGLEILTEAIRILKKEGLPSYEIHICGVGEIEFQIPGVKIYYAADSFPIMARAKVFLSIQQYENYPSQSLIEAMASGCAIIATDVGETRRLLHPKCAVLIPNDGQALADAMTLLAEDAAKRKDLAKAAQLLILQSHTIERFADYFLSEHC